MGALLQAIGTAIMNGIGSFLGSALGLAPSDGPVYDVASQLHQYHNWVPTDLFVTAVGLLGALVGVGISLWLAWLIYSRLVV